MLKEWKYGIAAVLILFLLLIASILIYKPSFDQQELVLHEQPIKKIKQFALKAGEEYTYMYKIGSNTTNITYRMLQGPGCIFIDIVEAEEVPLCVDAWGNDANASNITLAAPFLTPFRPWMLAVDDGWSWSAWGEVSVGGHTIRVSEINFSVLWKEKIYGRDAYKVVMYENGGQTFIWVDDEQRILLREIGPAYEVALVNAPFPLER